MRQFHGANPYDRLTLWVKRLLVANFILFLMQMMFPEIIMTYAALRPINVIQKFWIWQLFTYAFLHGNFLHLLFNMFALWMFGSHVERALGSPFFIKFYLYCVLGAALTQGIMAPYAPVVGASGGIYGILIAFGFLFPDTIIYLFFILPLRAIQAVIFFVLITLVSAVSSGGSRVAHFAHLGGMLTGFLLLKFPVWKENFQLWRAKKRFQNPKGRRRVSQKKMHDLQEEVNRILDKISAEGVESLTQEEHQVMKQYAQKRN
ncbi:hypothetical protein BVX98_00735 [bacterium F11]|nr:hypothetical protein BVX98_00735 [bacterium F11]